MNRQEAIKRMKRDMAAKGQGFCPFALTKEELEDVYQFTKRAWSIPRTGLTCAAMPDGKGGIIRFV